MAVLQIHQDQEDWVFLEPGQCESWTSEYWRRRQWSCKGQIINLSFSLSTLVGQSTLAVKKDLPLQLQRIVNRLLHTDIIWGITPQLAPSKIAFLSWRAVQIFFLKKDLHVWNVCLQILARGRLRSSQVKSCRPLGTSRFLLQGFSSCKSLQKQPGCNFFFKKKKGGRGLCYL